jgi:dTDP-4-dehydrorhamnose reductase
MTRQPRVWVSGAEGQLGFELVRALQGRAEIIATNRTDVDLANADSISQFVRATQPDLIFNPAAYTAVDKAESEPDLAMAVNGIAPGVIGEEARKLGAPVVHFSTDYVFDGTATVPYKETDATNPQSVYGRTKLAGEIALAQSGATFLIFRTSWLYAARGKNFFLTMLRLAREREELRVVADQIGSPTWVRPVADAAVAVIDWNKLGAAIEPGLYHLAAAGQTSWHGFAEAILRTVPDPERKATRVAAITTADYPTPARRPGFSVLDGGKWGTVQRGIGIAAIGDWRSCLRRCAQEAPPAHCGKSRSA